jgi:hypothetical protein
MAWAAGSRGGRDGAGDRPLDAVELKQRYRGKWPASVRRERFVLAALNAFLPPQFEARLTGLGAGEDRLIERSYGGLGEAFDITVYHGDIAVAYVDVTGVEDVASMRRSGCRGRCVGSWKLGKARKHRVVDRVWFAWVNDENASTYWISARWLDQHAESPSVSKCRLYRDERIVLCPPDHAWKRFKAFKNWLVHTAVYQALAQARG